MASIVAALEQRIATLPDLRAARTNLIADVDAEIHKRHILRKQKYAELTAASDGRLNLRINKGGERGRYVEAMLQLKTGSLLQDSTIEQICQQVLDITSVYEDVTLQLRSRKNSRQFILTTHNPTVAVAGDSDQFHVLRATASQADFLIEGAIDRPIVRSCVRP